MADIYHIIERDHWEHAIDAGTYSPDSLEHEGFIHCCRAWQILDIANTRYPGQTELMLLRIDLERVVPEVRNEDLYDDGETFPHIYGPLGVEAVTTAVPLPRGENGVFALPPELN